jgi:hypothetical protein
VWSADHYELVWPGQGSCEIIWSSGYQSVVHGPLRDRVAWPGELRNYLEQWLSKCGPRTTTSSCGLARGAAKLFLSSYKSGWVGIAQSRRYTQATGWKVRDSNSGERKIFRTSQDQPSGLPSCLYNGYRVFPKDKVAGAWH